MLPHDAHIAVAERQHQYVIFLFIAVIFYVFMYSRPNFSRCIFSGLYPGCDFNDVKQGNRKIIRSINDLQCMLFCIGVDSVLEWK
ncbi:MAG TPA: hypothetical protein DEQ30_11945 [Porphyromonadaceae bacterium]|nr:hypothetical protein [Porphyromonadaceae bacterium]